MTEVVIQEVKPLRGGGKVERKTVSSREDEGVRYRRIQINSTAACEAVFEDAEFRSTPKTCYFW